MMQYKAFYCKWRVRILVTLVLFLWAATPIYAYDKPQNVLILNSYHKGLLWTDEQTDGVVDVLNSSEKEYTIAVEYMDWKCYPTSRNLENLSSSLKYKYKNKKVDLIVTTDDAALEFALKHRKDIFSNAPIVFSGVNEKGVSEILKGHTKVTGVVENVDPAGTLKSALKINPNIKEVYVIFDKTESGLSTGEMTLQAINQIDSSIKITTLNEMNLGEVVRVVQQASDESIILITTYYTDKDGKIEGFQKFCKLISENSKVPVYHLYDFGMGYGAVGGSVLSGRLQGEAAGEIAARILQGESVLEIPISTVQTTKYIFDYKELVRFNISEDRLPEKYEIINKPFSFFETYRSLVMTALTIFVLLIVFIGILLFYIKKIHRMKEQLYRSHQKLTKVHQELTISDGKLKQQYMDLEKAQEALKESKKQYALLFEKTMNGFFIFEPVFRSDKSIIDIRFLIVNPGFEHHTQLSTNDIVGKTWSEVFEYPCRDLCIYEQLLQTGQTELFETYYPEANTYYLVNAFKISDNQAGVVFDNISKYKMAIKKIRTLNEELEERVEERTCQLQEAVKELEAFTYTVSHDLKAPIRAVDGYSRMMVEDFREKLNKEELELLQNIRGICSDTLQMINKLLQYSTTSRSTISKEKLDMKELFMLVAEELKLAHPERDIRFIIETELPYVYADKILMKQVIYNVLSNAVKFTKDRQQARIIIGNTITGEEYVFYIKDNGVGFDMEYSKKLFGIFQRLHTSDEFEGTGIGLVTVKKIIQKHGGNTWIVGEVDKGTTLYFSLPFSWVESAEGKG